VASKRNREFKA